MSARKFSIRIAKLTDSDAVSAMLERAIRVCFPLAMTATCSIKPCRILPRLIQRYLLVALTTLRRQNQALLSGVVVGGQRNPEAERSLKGKHRSLTLQLIPSGPDNGLEVRCLLVASVMICEIA